MLTFEIIDADRLMNQNHENQDQENSFLLTSSVRNSHPARRARYAALAMACSIAALSELHCHAAREAP
jgi:hypothetical protein